MLSAQVYILYSKPLVLPLTKQPTAVEEVRAENIRNKDTF